MNVDIKTIVCKPVVPITLFSIFVALFILQLVSLVLSSHPREVTSQPLVAKIITKQQAPQSSLNVPLFGDYVPTNIADEDVKQSMRDLDVVGIIYDTDEKKSHIIIQSEGGIEKILYTGDTLPGGGVIKRITQEGVLVGENGDLESLSLPKNELIFEPPAKPLIGE